MEHMRIAPLTFIVSASILAMGTVAQSAMAQDTATVTAIESELSNKQSELDRYSVVLEKHLAEETRLQSQLELLRKRSGELDKEKNQALDAMNELYRRLIDDPSIDISSAQTRYQQAVTDHKQAEQFDVNGLNEHLFLGRFGYTYPQLEPYFDSNMLQRKDYYSEFDILSVLAGGSDKSLAFSIVGEPTLRWLQLKYPVLKSTISVRGVSDVAPLQLQFGRTQRAKKLCDDFNHFYADFKKTEQFKQILLKYGL
jgi:hypothetical protein